MWTVYFQLGYHGIKDCTDEQFEELKNFYHLFETEDGKYTNSRGDIHAWRKKV